MDATIETARQLDRRITELLGSQARWDLDAVIAFVTAGEQLWEQVLKINTDEAFELGITIDNSPSNKVDAPEETGPAPETGDLEDPEVQAEMHQATIEIREGRQAD